MHMYIVLHRINNFKERNEGCANVEKTDSNRKFYKKKQIEKIENYCVKNKSHGEQNGKHMVSIKITFCSTIDFNAFLPHTMSLLLT